MDIIQYLNTKDLKLRQILLKNVQMIKGKLREEEHTYQHIQKLIRGLSMKSRREDEFYDEDNNLGD